MAENIANDMAPIAAAMGVEMGETQQQLAASIPSAQKAAAVVIALGAENASNVYKNLRDEDVEQLTFEIAKLEYMEPRLMEAVLNDFFGMCLTQKVLSEGGADYAMDVLEKAFGSQVAMSLMERISKSLRTKAFEFVRKADYKNLLAVVQNESPQTIALILSHARPEQASSILAELPKDKRIDVVERIAKMDRASPDTIKIVEQTLERKFNAVVSTDFAEVGGINQIADIMNNVDRATEKFVFDELSIKDPKLADEIRKRMFVFEDIIVLDSMAIQRFLRDVDAKDLPLALKSSNQEVQQIILANMSQRQRETVLTDMEYLRNVRVRDAEEAQQRIVAVIRKLEDEGELVISKGGKDEMIV